MSRMVLVALFLCGAACAQQPMIFVSDDPGKLADSDTDRSAKVLLRTVKQ